MLRSEQGDHCRLHPCGTRLCDHDSRGNRDRRARGIVAAKKKCKKRHSSRTKCKEEEEVERHALAGHPRDADLVERRR